MGKLITKTLLGIYQQTIGRKVATHLKLISKQAVERSGVDQNALDGYLRYFGRSGNILDQKLTDKESLQPWISRLSPSRISGYVYTGGSSGQPFRLPYSKERLLLKTASFLHFNSLAGYRPGDPFVLIAAKESPNWKQWLRNEIRFVPKDLSEEKLFLLAKAMRINKVSTLIGFSSVALRLANCCEVNRIELSLSQVIFTSEPVAPETVERVSTIFGCKVIDRYSNEEVGLIAQQRYPYGPYLTNGYNVLVEILDGENRPVRSGERGRVVLTDIASDLVPMIRYDTGDLAIAGEYYQGQLYSLSEVSGRVSEQLYTCEGVPLAALSLSPVIHMNLSSNGYYFPYQFAQTAENSYQLRIVGGGIIPEARLLQIKAELVHILGPGAQVNIVFPLEIPALASGKRPVFRNEWKN